MSKKRKSYTPRRYVDPGVVIIDPMNYKKDDEPGTDNPLWRHESYRWPFKARFFKKTQRDRGDVMVRAYDDNDMTKRQAYDEVFKSINAKRKNKKIDIRVRKKTLNMAPGKKLNRLKRGSDVTRKNKAAKMRREAEGKPAFFKLDYSDLGYRDAVKKRSLLRNSAKTYNQYLDNNKRVAGKLNWCNTVGVKVDEMIKDKVRRWTDAQIKELMGKIQGYKKAPPKARKPRASKTSRKPNGKSKRRIILEPGDRGAKKARKELTDEEKAARVAKMQAGLDAWRRLTPAERAKRAEAKRREKQERSSILVGKRTPRSINFT